MQKSTVHWPSIIILVIVISGAGLFLLTAIGFGIASIVSLVTEGADPAGAMIASLAAGFEGLLLAGIAWFVFQKTNGQERADQPFRLPFELWHIFVALGVAVAALVLGGVVSFLEVKLLSWLVLPLLTIALIVLPIWILVGVGTNKLDFGPRWRALGIFGIGMTFGPLIMVFLEIILLVFVVVFASLYIANQPGMVEEITRLASLLENQANPEELLNLLAPYIINPSVIGVALGFISLAVPMIEELFKPLGVWLFMRKIETPAQGFALGLLSGAAYALVESLGASGRGDTSWMIVVIVRAGTSLLHIMTTGLMGWAIISAMRERRYWRLIGTYALVILIHGIWNASAISTSLAIVSDMAINTSWSISIIPAAVCGIMVLGIGMLILLVASNRKVRKLSTAAIPVEADNAPQESHPQSDEGVK